MCPSRQTHHIAFQNKVTPRLNYARAYNPKLKSFHPYRIAIAQPLEISLYLVQSLPHSPLRENTPVKFFNRGGIGKAALGWSESVVTLVPWEGWLMIVHQFFSSWTESLGWSEAVETSSSMGGCTSVGLLASSVFNVEFSAALALFDVMLSALASFSSVDSPSVPTAWVFFWGLAWELWTFWAWEPWAFPCFKSKSMNPGDMLGKALRAILSKSLFERDWCPWCEIGSCIGFVGDGSSSKSIITTSSLDELVCWFPRDCDDTVVDEVLGTDLVPCVPPLSDGTVTPARINDASGRCRTELGRCGGVWWWVKLTTGVCGCLVTDPPG